MKNFFKCTKYFIQLLYLSYHSFVSFTERKREKTRGIVSCWTKGSGNDEEKGRGEGTECHIKQREDE